MEDNFDLVNEALNVAEDADRKLTEEEETALLAFMDILDLCPPTVLRGVRRALTEGWIDGSSTDKSAKYPDLVTLIKRELGRWHRETIERIKLIAPPVEEYSRDIKVFDDPDTSELVCTLLGQLLEYTSEVHGEMWL